MADNSESGVYRCETDYSNSHALYIVDGEAYHVGSWGVAHVVSSERALRKYRKRGSEEIDYSDLPDEVKQVAK